MAVTGREAAYTYLGTAFVAALITVALYVIFWRQRDARTPTFNREFALRIDDIPVDKPFESLKDDIRSFVEQDPCLKELVVAATYHFLTPRDHKRACATATFHTSLSPNELTRKLKQAAAVQKQHYHFDAHFHGITPLYEGQSESKVDLIAVHGLGSHAIGAWRSPGGSDVWLRDYLPDDLPNIRILLYGYNTPLQGNDSKDSIEDLGRRFLESVKSFRHSSESENRPMILIGHSLGGLVLKEALVHADKKSADPQNAYFSKACRALLLFGVPNLGLRNEQLLSIVGGRPNESLIRDLVVDNDSEPSSFLKRIAEQFAESYQGQFKVISFFERQLSSTVKIQRNGKLERGGPKTFMVTEKSATSTGLTAAADETNISFDTDHTSLVKYKSQSQIEYCIVKEKLKLIVLDAEDKVIPRFSLNQIPELDLEARDFDPELLTECRIALAFPEMNDRLHDVDEATNGTCEWISQHPYFREWWSANRGLLWIKGKPGSGKSTLLKFTIQQVRPLCAKETLVTTFFFHGRGSELQACPLGLLRSLLHQMLAQHPNELTDLLDAFEERRDGMGSPGKAWAWHLNELMAIHKSALSKILAKFPIVVFVDALDECGEDNAVHIVHYFQELITNVSPSSTSFHICFTCRHYPILTLDYGLAISVEHENGGDISTFVRNKMSNLPEQWRSQLPDMITEQASGVFLWARMVLERLEYSLRKGAGANKIKTELQTIPKGLNELYDGIIQGMDDKISSLKLLQWICFSKRPLSVDELWWAMAVDADCQHKRLSECWSEGDWPCDEETTDRRLKILSCGLLEIIPSHDDSIVQVIHQSVKDFLVEKGLMVLDASSATAEMAAGKAHYRLSRICIQYLMMEENFISVHPWPLLQYAMSSWVDHAREGEIKGFPQGDLVDYFEWPSRMMIDRLIDVSQVADLQNPDRQTGPFRLTKGMSLLHVASKYSLEGILSVILKTPDLFDGLNARDIDGRTPLHWAVEGGHTLVVRKLLATDEIDINSTDGTGMTSLAYAAEGGHAAIVKLLLMMDKIDVNRQDHDLRTPLALAAKGGHAATVKLLLMMDKIDLNLPDSNNRTPLSTAAQFGHEEIVKLLLMAEKIDINAQTVKGDTAVSLAAHRGYSSILRMLIDTHRAAIDVRNEFGYTPLSLASEHGRESTVRMLLDTGQVDVASKDKRFGFTPLSWAIVRGHEAVVKLFLEMRPSEVSLMGQILVRIRKTSRYRTEQWSTVPVFERRGVSFYYDWYVGSENGLPDPEAGVEIVYPNINSILSLPPLS